MYSKSLTKEIAKFKASCTSRERNSYYAVLYEGGLGITDSTICFAASGRMPSGGLYFQAARIPTEYSNTMWAFIDLVDAGVNAKLAFAISMCVRGGDYRNGTIDFSSSSTNHQCLEPDYFYSGTLKNMYEGAFTELKPFKVCTNYRKDISLLGEVAKKSISLNPFKRVEDKPSTTYKFDYKRAIKATAIFAKTIEEDFVNA